MSDSKALKPCMRCGGPKSPETTKRGTRFCPPCQEVVRSTDYQRDIDRRRAQSDRLAAIDQGTIARRRSDAPAGQKWCAHCQRFLPLTSFASSGDKLAAYCIPCLKDYNHAAKLAREFGITVERYDELMQIQDGRCAICLARPRKRRLAVDHDHETGEIRGLLCTRCNHGILGKAHDSVSMLMRAVSYLRRPPAQVGEPVADHVEDQADLEFLHEQIPFLDGPRVAVHARTGVVAVSGDAFRALAQAAGYAVVVDGQRMVPPKDLALDDFSLLEQMHASWVAMQA